MSVKVLEYDNYEDDFSDFDDGEVREGGLFDADGEEWEWLESESDVVHLDFDNWQVWSASNGPEVAFFVVDIDTGFIDWGPCDTKDEAKEFLQSKVNDWELESVQSEGTVKKSNGKWTNRGKNGEHGEFATKKDADAQRKAMYANGYKGESKEYPVYANSPEDGMSEDDCYPIGYIKANDKESAEKIFNRKYKSTRGTMYILGDPETESVKTESGNDVVTIGIYGDECGDYESLDSLVKALKAAGLKVTDLEGDEEYGWEMNITGPAKKIFKMVDGHVPGYDCPDVQDFVDEYSIEDLYESVNESKRFWVEINDSDGNLYDSMWVYCDKKSQVNNELKKMLGPGYKARSIEEESYSVKIEGVNGSENQMTITVGSHLNSDGFDVCITDPDGNEVFEMDYAYGWDASYDRKFASKDKPYVSDIINELVQEYNVDRSSIKVVNGRNVFNGKDVDRASEFSSKYLECTNTGDISNASAKHIRMFKDLDKREESIKSEGVKLSSDLMRFYKIIEDLNRYTSMVMTQLRGDSDLKQYAVGAAAVKIGTALDQIAEIRDSMN